jgi:DNA-binding Lrp family transcriptional regulator
MVMAHVLISCDPGFEDQIVSELKKFDTVHEARAVYGVFDIVVKLESPNPQEIRDNIVEDIRKIKSILSTVTLIDVDE